jgi:hypothetical protein
MKSKIAVMILISVVSLWAQGPAVPGQPACKGNFMPSPGGPGGGPGMGENPGFMMFDTPELQNLMDEININKTVSTKVLAIARTFKKLFEERLIKIKREELNVKEELLKDTPDLQAVQAAINRKTQVFGEIEFAQIKRDLEIKSLLTPDEYDRWKSAMMQKMRRIMPIDPGTLGQPGGDKKPAQK